MPLAEYAGVKPYRGILTGLNEAFLIDTPTRDALVAADPGCAEIIRRYFRGQDIDRWHAPWAGLWMIFTRRGTKIERYPSVLAHLSRFRDQLEPRPAGWQGDTSMWSGRKPGNYQWFEIQDAVDYWECFLLRKIIYQVIQYRSGFAFDDRGVFSNDKTFIIPTDSPWLLSVLNSPLMWWHNWRYLPHLKDEALSPMGYLIEALSIAASSEASEARAVTIVATLIDIHANAAATRDALTDWYRTEHGIERPNRALANPFALDAEGFAAEVRRARGARRPLSPAGVAAVRAAWRETVAPIRERLKEADRLECELSDMVNAAYGLTPEEVRLMWETAPPRMPLAAPDAAQAWDSGSRSSCPGATEREVVAGRDDG